MKKTKKQLIKFILSRSLFLIIGIVIAITIVVVRAAWHNQAYPTGSRAVNDVTPLKPNLWNDLVEKISKIESKPVFTKKVLGAIDFLGNPIAPYNVDYGITQPSSGIYNITFPPGTFTNPPFIIATVTEVPFPANPDSVPGGLVVVTDVTNTGATIRTYRRSTGSTDYSFYFVAIE